MDLTKFDAFKKGCCENLPKVVDAILGSQKTEDRCAIGLVTSDDFYGFYETWAFGDEIDILEYSSWETQDLQLSTDFLYEPLVEIVEKDEIDFCEPSEEKWGFAVELLTVLQDVIRQIPQEIFEKNGFQREKVLFFATMSDGDYVQEMLETSIKMFNTPQTQEEFGC